MIFLPFLCFDSGFILKKMMMKWMVVLILFLYGCLKQNCSANLFFNRHFFIRTASFYLNSSCFFGFKYSFSLALILFLLHLWSCTHVLSFLDRSVIFVCFHYFFFDKTTIEDLIAGTLNDTLREKLLLVSEQEWLLGCFWPFSCVYTIN